jgi:hypothetical protein
VIVRWKKVAQSLQRDVAFLAQQVADLTQQNNYKGQRVYDLESKIGGLNRYIDELKAEGRIIVVARQYDHFQAWCRANGYHHRDTGKAIFISTSDYKSSRGYNARPQDRVVLYGPWRGGRCADEVIDVLRSCGFKREEMEEVRDA